VVTTRQYKKETTIGGQLPHLSLNHVAPLLSLLSVLFPLHMFLSTAQHKKALRANTDCSEGSAFKAAAKKESSRQGSSCVVLREVCGRDDDFLGSPLVFLLLLYSCRQAVGAVFQPVDTNIYIYVCTYAHATQRNCTGDSFSLLRPLFISYMTNSTRMLQTEDGRQQQQHE
jgi:hypothetical protein